MSLSHSILIYIGFLVFAAIIDWLFPDNLMLYGFPLFGSGSEYNKAFHTFYNRRFVFRMVINAIVFIPAFFTQLGDPAIIAAAVIFVLQSLFDTWRADVFARRQTGTTRRG